MTDSTGTNGTGTRELGPESGQVLVRTGREGLAARAGHDLTLEITDWHAEVTTSSTDGLEEATVTADLDLTSLAVRAATGGAKPLSDKDRRDIQKQARKILGIAARSTFTSQRVIPTSDTPASGVIDGTLTLHGASRAIQLLVTNPEPGRYLGSTTIKQTDFGITPYTGFFGALKLSDEVTVEFDVTIEGMPNESA
jgi:polyisoprenoid-binding protein YceI